MGRSAGIGLPAIASMMDVDVAVGLAQRSIRDAPTRRVPRATQRELAACNTLAKSSVALQGRCRGAPITGQPHTRARRAPFTRRTPARARRHRCGGGSQAARIRAPNGCPTTPAGAAALHRPGRRRDGLRAPRHQWGQAAFGHPDQRRRRRDGQGLRGAHQLDGGMGCADRACVENALRRRANEAVADALLPRARCRNEPCGSVATALDAHGSNKCVNGLGSLYDVLLPPSVRERATAILEVGVGSLDDAQPSSMAREVSEGRLRTDADVALFSSRERRPKPTVSGASPSTASGRHYEPGPSSSRTRQ